MSIKSLRNYASSCIRNYSTFDGEQYDLQVSNLPDFVRHEFAAYIMSYDKSYASEATGADNDLWESKMLPALLRYLQNSTNLDESIEFKNTWRDCVTSHLYSYMQELINNELGDYNYENGCVMSSEETYGVQANAYR